MTLTAATCFSGIGAPEVAMPNWDWKFHAEIKKFPSAVMTARHPESVNLGDVLAPDFIERAKALGPIDVMAGGPPCQGFSVAGLRGGMSDPRGNLTLRWVQILHAIQPRNAVTENVPGWLSMPDNAFGCFLAGLVGADDALHSPLEGGKWPGQGMASGPRARCAWRILDAQYSGVAQRRRRVFVVADFGNGADPAQVLFERQGLQGNTPPSREKGKDLAPTIGARASSSGGQSDTDGGVVCARMTAFGEYVDDGTASTIKQRDYKDATDQIGCVSFKPSHYTRGKDGAPSDISPPLTADADKGDQDAVVCAPIAFPERLSGTQYASTSDRSPSLGAANPMAVAIQAGALRENPNSGPDGIGVQEDLAYTLEAGAEVQAVGFAQNQRDEVRTMDVAGALAAEPGMKQQTYVAHEPTVAWSIMPQNSGKDYKARAVDVAQPLMAGGPVGGNQGGDFIQQEWAVRRLTPVECARLQGFPDDYLDITFRNKPAADGNKYKALGNSWAVPCGQWILERIERFMP